MVLERLPVVVLSGLRQKGKGTLLRNETPMTAGARIIRSSWSVVG